MTGAQTVYSRRRYAVVNVADAKRVANRFLLDVELSFLLDSFGLPEVDDRYHIWRVPVLAADGRKVGEVVIDARTGQVQEDRSTRPEMLVARYKGDPDPDHPAERRGRARERRVITRSELRNTIVQGDSETTLAELPAESVDLVFTSPPYFNARPDYTEYAAYQEYLAKIGRVVAQCHRLLAEGRFFVINVSPVLLRRASRSQASRRIAVPFDLHGVITREGFDFVDDIIWEKPEGAGWATGRGRRFAADRNPLQYKAVPVTEYVLVYRKQTDKLIDWNIRNHPDPAAVAASRIDDGYERTNIWRITPTSSKDHPAVFPLELAEKVIRYYSFVDDVVLDPFAGSGTVGEASTKAQRRFLLAESEPRYVDVIKARAARWLGDAAADVECIGTPPIPLSDPRTAG